MIHLMVVGVESADKLSFVLGLAGVVVKKLTSGRTQGHQQGHETVGMAKHGYDETE